MNNTNIKHFWRFNYSDDAALQTMLDQGVLLTPAPLTAASKNPPEKVVAKKLKVGHGIVLAKFDGTAGDVAAIGVVRALSDDVSAPQVDWVRCRTQLYPNPSGEQWWRTEACFRIADLPAKRYRLPEMFARNFTSAA